MNRIEAKRLAETITSAELAALLQEARKRVTNWNAPSKLNKSFSVGAAFNILVRGGISTRVHSLVAINILREFGEFLPGYNAPVRKARALVDVHHEEPVEFPSLDNTIQENTNAK